MSGIEDHFLDTVRRLQEWNALQAELRTEEMAR